MRLGLFLDGEWSHNFLNLIDKKKFDIQYVIGRVKADIKLKKICKKKGIKFIIKKNINASESVEFLKKKKSDLLVSLSYDQIFKEDILKIYKGKIINCHAGYLPFYRGRNVINWAIANGEKYFGITTHFIDKGIDTGKIILRRKYKIEINDNYEKILKKAYIHCPKILLKTINLIKSKKKIYFLYQNKLKKKNFYWRKRNENDEIINLNLKLYQIHNLIRSISFPGPGAKLLLKEKKFKIKSSKLMKNNNKLNFKKKINFYKNFIYIKKNNFILKCSYE